MGSQWKVRVVGLVSRLDGHKRVALPQGEYAMTEVGVSDYELAADGVPMAILTHTEVGTYINSSALKVIEGDWP